MLSISLLNAENKISISHWGTGSIALNLLQAKISLEAPTSSYFFKSTDIYTVFDNLTPSEWVKYQDAKFNEESFKLFIKAKGILEKFDFIQRNPQFVELDNQNKDISNYEQSLEAFVLLDKSYDISKNSLTRIYRAIAMYNIRLFKPAISELKDCRKILKDINLDKYYKVDKIINYYTNGEYHNLYNNQFVKCKDIDLNKISFCNLLLCSSNQNRDKILNDLKNILQNIPKNLKSKRLENYIKNKSELLCIDDDFLKKINDNTLKVDIYKIMLDFYANRNVNQLVFYYWKLLDNFYLENKNYQQSNDMLKAYKNFIKEIETLETLSIYDALNNNIDAENFKKRIEIYDLNSNFKNKLIEIKKNELEIVEMSYFTYNKLFEQFQNHPIAQELLKEQGKVGLETVLIKYLPLINGSYFNEINILLKEFFYKYENKILAPLKQRAIYLNNLSSNKNINLKLQEDFKNLYYLVEMSNKFESSEDSPKIKKEYIHTLIYYLYYSMLIENNDLQAKNLKECISIAKKTNFKNDNEAIDFVIAVTAELFGDNSIQQAFNKILILRKNNKNINDNDIKLFFIGCLKYFLNDSALFDGLKGKDKIEFEKLLENLLNKAHIDAINNDLNTIKSIYYYFNYLDKNINSFSKNTQKILLASAILLNETNKDNSNYSKYQKYAKKLNILVSDNYDFESQLYQSFLDNVILRDNFKTYSYPLPSAISIFMNKSYANKSSPQIREYLLKNYKANNDILLYYASYKAFEQLDIIDLEYVFEYIKKNIDIHNISYTINIPLSYKVIKNIYDIQPSIDYFIESKNKNIGATIGIASGSRIPTYITIRVNDRNEFYLKVYELLLEKSIKINDASRINKYYYLIKSYDMSGQR